MGQTTTVPGMERRHLLAVPAGLLLLWITTLWTSELAAAATLLLGGALFLYGITRWD